MPGKIEGTVVAYGPAGNLVTDIPNDRLAGVPQGTHVSVTCDEHETVGIFPADHQEEPCTLMAILGAAAALATLDVFEEARTLENLRPKIARLAERLARLKEHPHVGDVRQRGLISGIELVADRASKRPYPWAEKRGMRVCQHALTAGVWLRPLGNIVVIMPPLAISLAELDTICDAVEQGIEVATHDADDGAA